jgi:serine-type D-Ala-D-Ala carboxypeptidase (penicillin-binding protein 5/6)
MRITKPALWIAAPALAFALAGCVVPGKPRPPTPVAAARPAVASPPPGAPTVWPSNAPEIFARSAILLDARTGRTLYQKHADLPGPVASTQKLLTALLVLKDGSLDRPVLVGREETLVEPTKLGLRAGETYTRRALLAAMMIKSENDAAAALARDVAGSQQAFAARMNRAAWDLGAQNSLFANPHGLPDNQFSTARDIGRIAFRAYREPILRKLMATKHLTFFFNSGRKKHLENTNKLLGRFPPANGMKTGYTAASGRCLVASASYAGRDVILVQIGSRTSRIFNDAERMLTWGLARAGVAAAPASL